MTSTTQPNSLSNSGGTHSGTAEKASADGGLADTPATPVLERLPPPPFDPELGAVLDALAGTLPPALDISMLAQMRAGSAMFDATDEQLSRGGTVDYAYHRAPGPAALPGSPEVSLLVARPAHLVGRTGVLYHVHGGGMVMGSSRQNMVAMLDLAVETGMTVVSVEYRLPPEHPHPAPVEDCYAGLLWTLANADRLSLDPTGIVLIGSSAGGGLAAALALLSRDRGGPRLAGQMLLSPMLDDRNDTPSAHQMAGRGMWDRGDNLMGWTALLGVARGGPNVSPYAAPGRAQDLSGLPPTYLDVGSAETFRDEVLDYANRLWRSGGDTELHVWPGGFHGFTAFAPDAALSRRAVAAQTSWLHRVVNAAVQHDR